MSIASAADLQEVHREEGADQQRGGDHRGAVTVDLATADEVHAGDQRGEGERVDDGDGVREEVHRRPRDLGKGDEAGERAEDDGVGGDRQGDRRRPGVGLHPPLPRRDGHTRARPRECICLLIREIGCGVRADAHGSVRVKPTAAQRAW